MKAALILILVSYMTSSFADSFKKFKLIAKEHNTSEIIFEETINESGEGSGNSMFGGEPLLKNSTHALLKASWSKDENSMTINLIVTRPYTSYYTHPESGEKLKTPVYDMDELSSLSRKAIKKVRLHLDRSAESAQVEIPELNIDVELRNVK